MSEYCPTCRWTKPDEDARNIALMDERLAAQ